MEAESLINDASVLIAYKMAVGVAVGISFSFFDAVSTFFISVIDGCLIGFILAHASIFVQKQLRLPDTALISFNLLLPFVAYLVAEHYAVSGVLAVVVMGLIQASKMHKREDVLEKTKIEFKSLSCHNRCNYYVTCTGLGTAATHKVP